MRSGGVILSCSPTRKRTGRPAAFRRSWTGGRGGGAGGGTAHRVGDDAHVRDAEVVEEGDDVGAEGGAAAAVAVGAEAKGAVVEGDAGVVLGEEGHLLPPAEGVGALAVREEDGRAGAVHLVVDVDAVDRRPGHFCD